MMIRKSLESIKFFVFFYHPVFYPAYPAYPVFFYFFPIPILFLSCFYLVPKFGSRMRLEFDRKQNKNRNKIKNRIGRIGRIRTGLNRIVIRYLNLDDKKIIGIYQIVFFYHPVFYPAYPAYPVFYFFPIPILFLSCFYLVPKFGSRMRLEFDRKQNKNRNKIKNRIGRIGRIRTGLNRIVIRYLNHDDKKIIGIYQIFCILLPSCFLSCLSCLSCFLFFSYSYPVPILFLSCT